MKALFHRIPQALVKHTFILCCLFACTHLSAQSNNSKQDSLVDVRAGFSSLFNITATGNKDKLFQFELNKSAVGFIQSYMEKQGPELIKMKTWAKPYFSLYDEILTANGIPVALKYLSVIESHLTPNLTSSAGAVGPWQLMPDEAERLGLKMTPVDERTDFKKSTLAAATILKELYAQFGDWLLVVAASRPPSSWHDPSAKRSSAPQPPGPGLPLQAPSQAAATTGPGRCVMPSPINPPLSASVE
jgi:membrane-bound lytic murein transglycosylase D